MTVTTSIRTTRSPSPTKVLSPSILSNAFLPSGKRLLLICIGNVPIFLRGRLLIEAAILGPYLLTVEDDAYPPMIKTARTSGRLPSFGP